MKLGLLILVAIICFSSGIYSASLGVVLFKSGKKFGSAILFSFTIMCIVFSFLSLKAI